MENSIFLNNEAESQNGDTLYLYTSQNQTLITDSFFKSINSSNFIDAA